MYHVQKCNENSLVFFSLTLNNRNRWDCLGMLEFVCCLPKLGTTLLLFFLIMFEQTSRALENEMRSSAITSSKSSPRTCILCLSCLKRPVRNRRLKVPACILPVISEANPKYSELGCKTEPKYVINVSSVCVET